MTNDLENRAIAILKANDRGGYTVPTAGLYPYQWNWDSAFAALGFATFDRDRAWREIETLFDGQWEDGMVPHIIFRKNDPGYFPGPDIWGSRTEPPTSGHSQPPVVASVARWLVETGGREDERRAHEMFPKLMAWHEWWHCYRDPDETGLVGIVHPWESGRDNCPDWDIGMNNIVVPDDLGTYHRRDTDWVDPSERPTQETYDRYLTIVKFGRECGWDHDIVVREGPFFMADPCVQFVLMRADRDLMALAERFDDARARGRIADWVARDEAGAQAMWSDEACGFVATDLRTGSKSPAITNASMLAFYGGAGTEEQRAEMVRHAREILDGCRYVFPSWDPRHEGFEQRRYWRGPVWSVMNWMMAAGFERHGLADLAMRVRRDTLAMVRQSGFFEYFDPLTGEGLGGPNFTWTAAIHLALVSEHGAAEVA
ncbi:MGH1-like glycoside hydrolase domain-containing protein [Oricola thermophila]|uniref:Mannosylglycerate hydrolase MGH1-like glycoside hydrolase domain-containing protein n=1 Tax=Oricola thermophila TaxID=2742145 RepID=A0A6N1VH17_9HYPH|nr:hypothetical protein [Oricola thermophila]QKV20078.1 hypothetical protein HTY61_17305 [Oricola thermophila]